MNSEKMNILKKVLNKASQAADQAEVFNLESGSKSIGFRNGVLRAMQESEDSGCCLRIIKNGRLAQVTTSNMEKAEDMVQQAMELVPFGEEVNFSFPEAADIPVVESAPKSDENLDKMVEESRVIIDKLKDYDSSLMPNAGSDISKINVTVLNSNGVEATYETTTQSLSAVAILAEEGNILSTFRYHMGQEPCKKPEELADKVINLTEMGRKNVPFSGGTIPILLTPYALADIFAAFGAGINGGAVAKGMSPLTGKLGEQILHEKISIVDDGLYPLATGTQAFDDEGIPCRRKYLVENGVLKNYLCGLNAASKLGVEPTGNGFRYTALIKSRSYAASPGSSFTNLILPAGDRSYEEILKSAPKMILIDQLTGVLLGNLINGDWSGNIEYGILYENGVPQGRIKNAMTGGNFYNMFKNMYAESSSERIWASGFGGGAGSSYFPYVLFDGMTVSA